MEAFMTLEEVAKYLRLSIHSVYKMAQQGRIPAMKAGTVWRFRKTEIDEWMKQSALKNNQKNPRKKQGPYGD